MTHEEAVRRKVFIDNRVSEVFVELEEIRKEFHTCDMTQGDYEEFLVVLVEKLQTYRGKKPHIMDP